MRASASAGGSRSAGPLSRGLLVGLVTLLGACGGGTSAPKCVPGNSRSCAATDCPHGAGTQMCEQTGIYTSCLCDTTAGGAGSTGNAGETGNAGAGGGAAAAVDGAAGADASATDGDAAEARDDATSSIDVGRGADAKPDVAPDGGATDGESHDGAAPDAADAANLEVTASSDGSTVDGPDAADAPLTCDADADACTPDAASD
jgi:hypothetical protein